MSGILLALVLLLQVPSVLQQQTGVVTGVVRTNGGMPLEGVRVAVTPAVDGVADSVLESIALTDKDGRYRLENVSPGRYYIVFGRGLSLLYHPGVPERESATTIVVSARVTLEAPDMVFLRVRIAGRVIDAATGRGRRIENLTICCEYSQLSSVVTGNPLLLTGSSAAFTAPVSDDGTFVLDSVPPGSYSVRADDPQIISMGQALSLGTAGANNIEVRVSSGVVVEGNVVDKLGSPASGVFVRLLPRSASKSFDLTAYPYAPAGITSVVFSPSLPNPTGASSSDIQGSLMRLVKTPSFPVEPDGRFSLSRVLPGFYTIEVNAPGGNSARREVEVGASGPLNVRIEMPFTFLTGRVAVEGGGDLPKLTGSLRIFSTATGSRILYAFPDTEGRFALPLEAGEYRILADSLGPSVISILEGSKDVQAQPLVFAGDKKQEVLITVER